MPEVNQNPLTIKYRTRLAAAMLLEARGYMFAKNQLCEIISALSIEELKQLEMANIKYGTLHARGVAKYIRELIASRVTAVAV